VAAAERCSLNKTKVSSLRWIRDARLIEMLCLFSAATWLNAVLVPLANLTNNFSSLYQLNVQTQGKAFPSSTYVIKFRAFRKSYIGEIEEFKEINTNFPTNDD